MSVRYYSNTYNSNCYVEIPVLKTSHLGSVRVMYSISDTCASNAVTYTLESANDYFAFGKSLRSFNNTGKFGYQGSEKRSELSDNDYYTHYRTLNTEIPRWGQVDPLADKFPWQSPYCSMDNNPVLNIDPMGDGTESTHTDKNGRVVAVYNDGDNGVYKHEDLSSWDKKSKLSNDANSKVGQTEFWDEFARHDKTGSILKLGSSTDNYADVNAKINFGVSIDGLVDAYHQYAKLKMDNTTGKDVLWLKSQSGNHQPLDIKTKIGENSGYLFGGNYISGESAGNYLFGKNLAYSGTYGFSKSEYWSLTAQQFGAYHNKANHANNPSVAPYYGEIPYSGRQVAKGYWGIGFQIFLSQYPNAAYKQ